MRVVRMAEEVFPFAYYYFSSARKLNERSNCPDILAEEEFSKYPVVPKKVLERRLKEEHRRAVALDDKTLRVSFFLSSGFSVLGLGLTILGASDLIAKAVSSLAPPILLTLLFVASTVYFLFSGFLALGAMRTYPLHGFGTAYELDRHKKSSKALLVKCLARQEVLNRLRHCRNEAVFQTTRNGIILLLGGIFLALFGYGTELLDGPIQTEGTTGIPDGPVPRAVVEPLEPGSGASSATRDCAQIARVRMTERVETSVNVTLYSGLRTDRLPRRPRERRPRRTAPLGPA